MFLICKIVVGQIPFIKNYNVAEGLASSEVYSITQDNKGYLWFATENGVSCFDGIYFRNFTSKDGLSDNLIIKVYKDSQGRIWLLPLTGPPVFFQNNHINQLPPHKSDEPDKFLQMLEDNNHRICFGSIGGIYIFSKNGKLKFMKEKSFDKALVEITCKDSANNLWILNSDTKTISILKNDSFYHFPIPKEILKSKKKYEYYGNSPLLSYLFSEENKSLKPNYEKIKLIEKIKFYFSSMKFLSCYIFEEKGIIFAKDGENGLKVFSLKGKLLASYFPNTNVSSVYFDNENNLWVSTIGKGIFCIPSSSFKIYKKSEGISDEKIVSISGFKNKIILGLNDGVINIIENSKIKIIGPESYHPDYKYRIISIVPINSSYSWIGMDNGLMLMNEDKLKFIDRDIGAIKVILKYNSNSILVGTHYSLFQVDSDKSIQDLGAKYNLCPIRINSILVSYDSSLFLGTDKGLVQIRQDSVIYYSSLDFHFKPRISSIVQLCSGEIICASNIYGLLLIDHGKVKIISEENGLASNLCKSIFIDPENKYEIWVGTNKGISQIKFQNINTQKFEINNYNSENGLSSNEVSGIYIYNDSVWVATSNGLTVFNKNLSASIPVHPPVYITHVMVNDRDTILASGFSLPYDRNNIKFEFVGISYKSMGKIAYRYKMSGLDTNWVYTSFPTAGFPSLPYGTDYTFLVEAKNIDGTWSAHPATLNFYIGLPFWQTLWFRGMIGLILVGGMAGIFKYQLTKLKEREEEKTKLFKKIAESEMKALRSQMNPHFTFNSLNSIQHFILKNDMVSAQKYLAKFSQLMRRILDNSKLSFINLAEEIETLKIYLELESLRFDKQFDYSFNIDKKLNIYNCKIPAMLIQPYLENAIWHGLMHKYGDRSLKIEMYKVDNSMICIIEDNRIGRKKSLANKSTNSTKHHSLGMQVTSERMEMLNSLNENKSSISILDLTNSDGVAIGTRVELTIPYEENY